MTRLRLTKTIYFVHKELIRKQIMQKQDIAYIRLPLGPTPENLPAALINHPNILIQDLSSNLLYENQSYTILSQPEHLPDAPEGTKTSIKKILKLLRPYSIPELVKASQDPSWLMHANGEKYYITATDLKNTFPNPKLDFKIRLKSTPVNNEIGALQATLLRGMLADIVKESTDLEYPDQDMSDLPPKNDKDSAKLHRFTIKILPSWPKKKDK